MQTNVIDILVAVIVGLSAVRGLLRGLSRELADLLRLTGSVLLAYFLYRPAAGIIGNYTRLAGPASSIVAFILILIAAFLILTLIHYLLSKFMEFAFKGPVERIGGFVSGTVKGAVFAGIILFLISLWPHSGVRSAVQDESLAGRWMTACYPVIYTNLARTCPVILEMRSSFTNSVSDSVDIPTESSLEVLEESEEQQKPE